MDGVLRSRQFAQNLQSGQTRHSQIEQEDVGTQLARQLDRALAIVGLTYDGELIAI
jgi:hypothetical protein